MFITRLPKANDPAYVLATYLVPIEIVPETLVNPVLADLDNAK